MVKTPKIDPITIEKRAKRYKLPGTYADSIRLMQENHHLNAPKLILRVKRGIPLIAKKSHGKSKTDIALKQALFVNRVAGKLVDAMIDAKYTEYDMHSSPPRKKRSGIDIFEEKPINEKIKIWNKQFEESINFFLSTPEIASNPLLKRYVSGVGHYLNLPENLFKSRKNHWKYLQDIEIDIKQRKIDPQDNFFRQLETIISKKKPGETTKVKALDVCIASSIYADLKIHEGGSWIGYYREAMGIAYNRFKGKHHDIIDKVLELK